MTEKMFRQEYLATFEEFSGMVYPMLDEKLHFIDYEPNVPLQYFISLDVGFKTTAVLLLGEDSARNLYVLEESYLAEQAPADIANTILRMRGTKHVRNIIIDPASRQKVQASNGVSVAEQIEEHGVNLDMGVNDVMGGIMRVQQLLIPDRVTGGPRIKIHNRCINLKDELYSYVWKDNEEAPKKVYDHAVDALRYVVASRPDMMSSVDEHRNAPMVTGAIDLLENRIDSDLF
jgi:hypothetical protein